MQQGLNLKFDPMTQVKAKKPNSYGHKLSRYLIHTLPLTLSFWT